MTTSVLRYRTAGPVAGTTFDNLKTRPLVWALISQLATPISLGGAFSVSSLVDPGVGTTDLNFTFAFASLSVAVVVCSSDGILAGGSNITATSARVANATPRPNTLTDNYPQVAIYGPLP